MKRTYGVLVLATAMVAGCGDNSNLCGPNTKTVDGVCVGSDTAVCGDGTVKDDITGECVPSDGVCGGGTVLVNGTCQDPSAGLEIDLEEGPEPNGFEAGATPAGVISLKSAGGPGFVIHGCIQPLDGFTADVDNYLLTVSGPTLIKVSADGVQGLSAGFIALGDASVPAVASWFRLGINVATDTSKRELFLPAPGTYNLVIADTRSLYPITEGIQDLPPAGNPDGTSCYYVTVDAKPIPTPTTLDLAAGDAGTIGEDLKFYTGAFPTGYTSLVAVIDPEDLNGDGIKDVNSRAASSLVVLDNNLLRQVNDAGAPTNTPDTTPVSAAFFGGIRPGDTPLVVLDYVWNYAVTPAAYSIQVQAALPSDGLSVGGGIIPAVGGSHGQLFVDATGNSHLGNLNLFHFDVDTGGQTDGVNLVSTIALDGAILDQDGFFLADLTRDLLTARTPASPSITFTSYLGLLRMPAPGRYYLAVVAPRNPVGTAFTMTSTITPLDPAVVTLDTPTAPQPVNAFKSNPFSFDGSAAPWELLDARGGVGTGNLLVNFYDPATAFGRLDTIATRSGPGAGTLDPGGSPSDVFALQQLSFTAAGATPVGRIFLNPIALTPPAASSFFVKVNPTVPTGTSYILDFQTRLAHLIDHPAVPSTTIVNTEPLDATHAVRRYLVKTDPGNVVKITVSPAAGLDAVIGLLDTNEVETPINKVGAGQPETFRHAANASGFLAFQIRGAVAGNATFSLAVQVDPPFYTSHAGTTAFADACVGGMVQPLVADGTGFPPDDEGFTASTTLPAGLGFTFYGTPVTHFIASSNGFLSFKAAIPDAGFFNAAMPDGVGNANIAVSWSDLAGTVVCTKSLGATRFVIQWRGADLEGVGAAVEAQAILDSADQSIEIVWGPGQVANGIRATAGAQSTAGDEATQLGSNTVFAAPGTSKKLTHP